MIRTSFATFGAAALLLGASACAESNTSGLSFQDRDPVVPEDGGQDFADSDASEDEEGGGRDGGDEGQIADDGDEGEELDAGTEPVDGATDAEPEADAAVEADSGADEDAGETDAGGESEDASTEEPAPEPALFARYTFDENTGTTAADSAGDFGPAELLNGAGFTAGVDGSALALGGAEQYATLPANILSGCNDITVALWMKLGSLAPWARLLDIDGGVDGFLFLTPTQYIEDKPHLYFNIWHAHGDQGVSAAYPAGATLVNEWHHVAFTLSGGIGRLYFDGAEIGSKAMLSKPSDVTLGAGARAWIGRSLFPSDPYLEATIDDLRVSCTAFSAEQVAELVP